MKYSFDIYRFIILGRIALYAFLGWGVIVVSVIVFSIRDKVSPFDLYNSFENRIVNIKNEILFQLFSKNLTQSISYCFFYFFQTLLKKVILNIFDFTAIVVFLFSFNWGVVFCLFIFLVNALFYFFKLNKLILKSFLFLLLIFFVPLFFTGGIIYSFVAPLFFFGVDVNDLISILTLKTLTVISLVIKIAIIFSIFIIINSIQAKASNRSFFQQILYKYGFLFSLIVFLGFIFFVVIYSFFSVFYYLTFFLLNYYGFIVVIIAFILTVYFFAFRLKKGLIRTIFYSYWIYVWVCLIFVLCKFAPGENECNKIFKSEEIIPVISRSDFVKIDKFKDSLPYDCILDERENLLLVSFKNRKGYGKVMIIDLNSDKRAFNYFVTRDENNTKIMYPERLAIDKNRKEFYVSIKSPANFSTLVGTYGRLWVRPKKLLYVRNSETTNCLKVPERDELFVLYLPTNISAVRVFDVNNYKLKKQIFFTATDYNDYFSIDRVRKRLFVPSFGMFLPPLDFHMYVIDLTSYKIKKVRVGPSRFRGYPTLGIAFDNLRNKIYLGSPYTREILKMDGNSYKIEKKVTVGPFTREIEIDERRNLLYTANFGDGTVNVLDTNVGKVIRRYYLGGLLRSVNVDSDTGRAFATSGCGVFEMKVNRNLDHIFQVNKFKPFDMVLRYVSKKLKKIWTTIKNLLGGINILSQILKRTGTDLNYISK